MTFLRSPMMTGGRQQIQLGLFRITVPSPTRNAGGFTQILHQVVRRSHTWRENNQVHRVQLNSWPDVIRSEVTMPVTKVPSLRLSRDGSLGRASSNSGEMVLKNLAEQLLTDDELWVFKQTLQHFRVTRSVPSLCTALRPLITNTERLMLLVELAQHLPTEPLRRDFQKLCTLNFPKYHTFLRYFTPQPVTDGSKVIAQDASGQYLVANKVFDKNAYSAHTNGTLTSEPRPDTTSMHGGAESGFYSEQDDASRHGNGRGSVSSKAGTSPSESAPSTLHRPPRPYSQSQSQRASSSKRQSLGFLSSGPLKILSGSFQSLAFNRKNRKQSAERREPQSESGLHQKRILLARRKDGSLGVGIKGGKEYGTPIVVYVVEEGCQAEQQGLVIGDRIIDVNGTDFTHLTHAEAVTMMRNAWNIIMTVESDGSAAETKARRSSEGVFEDGTPNTEMEILVYPSIAGKLGCAVNRDADTGDIMVKSVEKNSAAGKAGLLKGDTILEIDGMVVNTLTERQIATLTNSKRVRLRLRRRMTLDGTAEVSTTRSKSRTETVSGEEAFSPLDFSSPAPVMDDDMFTFAASTPRNPMRSRSEERILSHSHSHSAPVEDQSMWGTKTSPDVHNYADLPEDGVQRIYRPRTMAMPSTRSHQQQQQQQPQPLPNHVVVRNGAGGGVYHTMTSRGRPAVRQPPPHSPRYTIVYSVRGRSTETIVHPEVKRKPPPAPSAGHATQSRNSKMRFIRNRSRSRDSTAHNTSLSPADRDLLQAVQSGVEKRQRAVRLSLYQVPDDDDDDWRI